MFGRCEPRHSDLPALAGVEMIPNSSGAKPIHRSRQSLLIVLLFSLLAGGAGFARPSAQGRAATIERPELQKKWLGNRALTRATKDDVDPSSSPNLAGVAPRIAVPLPRFRELCAAFAAGNMVRSNRRLPYRARAPPAA